MLSIATQRTSYILANYSEHNQGEVTAHLSRDPDDRFTDFIHLGKWDQPGPDNSPWHKAQDVGPKLVLTPIAIDIFEAERAHTSWEICFTVRDPDDDRILWPLLN